jgi:hypothetical protein
MSKLAAALQDLRATVRGIASDQDSRELRDAADLIGVLANVVDGMEPLRAMGAPGDWGYGTAIGDGLLDALRPRA